MEWGKAVYTVLPLPDAIARQLSKDGAKRVEGEINDHPVNLALTQAPVVDYVYLWAGKSLLDRCGIEPGETIEVRLRKADETYVDIPEDVFRALQQHEATALWNALTPGKQRGLLHHVTSAKRVETRAKRISAMIESLGT